MPSATFNPDANPETTSVDGHVSTSTVPGTDFSTLRAQAGSGSTDILTSLAASIFSGETTDTWEEINRAILLFDTSSLPDDAVISGVDLELYVTSHADTIGSQQFTVVGSTPASNTAIVDADFGQVGTTAYSNAVNLSSLTNSTYNVIPLNATGIAAVSLNGVTKLGIRLECDRANSAPTWVAAESAGISAQSADGTNKPKLVVTYTAEEGGTPGPATQGFSVQNSGIGRKVRVKGY